MTDEFKPPAPPVPPIPPLPAAAGQGRQRSEALSPLFRQSNFRRSYASAEKLRSLDMEKEATQWLLAQI